jgi:hypothetical protein
MIEVTDRAITLPKSRWAASHVTVPLDEIIRLRTTKLLGVTSLHVVWPEGQVVLPSPMLAGAADFDRLLGLLSERLEHAQVSLEPLDARPRKRPFRLQFSMAWLFLLVTFVAAALGMHGYVYGGYSWDAAFDLGIALTAALAALWFASAAGWKARTFFLGFAFGYCLELLAVYCWFALEWVRFPAGSNTPENWYPLTFAVWQMGESYPPAVWLVEGPRASLWAGLVSGAACGVASLAGWWVVRRPQRG